MNDYTFETRSELVPVTLEDCIGTDEVWGVICTHRDGRRWHYTGRLTGTTQRAAEAAAFAMTAQLPTYFDWTPKAKFWVEGAPEYGSPAYQNGGGDVAYQSDLEPELLATTREHAHRLACERDADVAARGY